MDLVSLQLMAASLWASSKDETVDIAWDHIKKTIVIPVDYTYLAKSLVHETWEYCESLTKGDNYA